MVYSFLKSATLRTGTAEIKKAGLSSLKGWKQRWLVLNSATLIGYKNTTEPEIVLTLALDNIKQIECVNMSKDRPRCLHLTTHEGSNYYLSFRTTSELFGWREILDEITLSPVPRQRYELVEEPGEGYLTDSSNQITLVSDSSKLNHVHPVKSQSYSASRPTKVEYTLHPTRSTPNLALRSTETTSQGRSRNHLKDGRENFTPFQRSQVRRAITILCQDMEPRMLRISDPGGEKPFDLVEVRLRPLLRLQRKWKKVIDAAELDEETRSVFSSALKDGVVLCEFVNTLHSSPVIRPDPRELVNIDKFLAQCSDDGLSADELFLRGDITASSSNSLTRVARTIIALAKAVEAPDSRNSNLEALVNFSKDGLVRHSKSASQSSCVEVWVDRWIASRSAVSTVRYDVSSPTDGAGRSKLPKVYKNLVLFVLEMTRNQVSDNESLYRALKKLVKFMVSLDVVSSLVESAQFRVRLLQISAELKVSDNRLLRDAMHKDDLEIAQLLRSAISLQECKEAILGLQGEDAQSCIDLLQDVLDKACIKPEDDDGFNHSARRLLVKLSEAQNILPSSLFIKGVKREQADACCGGTFGDIYRASYKGQGQDVALKRLRIFQRDAARQKTRRKFCREALLWQRLHHPFVLPFIGLDSESFPSFTCLVSPWMRHGTVLKHLSEHGYTNIEVRLFEIAQGLAYLHSQKIVHGDLRGSNILVDEEWHARLADFGLAVFSDATITGHDSHRGGSVRWTAPELHHPQAFGLKHCRRTFDTDVYSFACVCIELYTGRPPFAEHHHDPAVMLRVLAGERPPRPLDVMGRPIPDYLWEIIQLCWCQDFEGRPTMNNVIEMMMTGNPELRKTLNVHEYSEVTDLDSTLHPENPGPHTLSRSRMFTRATIRPTASRHTENRLLDFRYPQDGKCPKF